jgi:cell division GTPase FtsZ
VPGDINVDFEDVRTVMGGRPSDMMGTAKANGPRPHRGRTSRLPLLEGVR